MVSSEVHLTGLSQAVTATESKYVPLRVGSKPADMVYTPSEVHLKYCGLVRLETKSPFYVIALSMKWQSQRCKLYPRGA